MVRKWLSKKRGETKKNISGWVPSIGFSSSTNGWEGGLEVDLSGCHQQSKITKIEDLEITLPETNSIFAPENGWLEYDPASYWGGFFFQGLR